VIEKTIYPDILGTEEAIWGFTDKKDFIKKASINFQGEIDPQLREFLDNFKPDPNYAYAHVVAVGAGEYWDANRNGDYFPEKSLIESYHTFLDGKVYVEHQHSDEYAIGKIVFAYYNKKMHRVELIIAIDRGLSPETAEQLDKGEMFDVSMGCKVPYDVCSVCGNKAKTTAEYCEHLKYQMGKILDNPKGLRVYAINEKPTFFDISKVAVGAEPTAKALKKVASLKGSNIMLKKAKEDKYASILKKLKGLAIGMDSDDFARNADIELDKTEPIPKVVIIKMVREADGDPLAVIREGMRFGIQFRDDEIDQMLRCGDPAFGALNQSEMGSLIANPYRPLPGRAGLGIRRMLASFMPRRSYLPYFFMLRMAHNPINKLASISKMPVFHEMYRTALEKNASLVGDVGEVGLLLALLAAVKNKPKYYVDPYEIYKAKTVKRNDPFVKQSSYQDYMEKIAVVFGPVISFGTGLAASHALSRQANQENVRRAKRGEMPDPMLDYLAKHPNLVGFAAGAALYPRTRKFFTAGLKAAKKGKTIGI